MQKFNFFFQFIAPLFLFSFAGIKAHEKTNSEIVLTLGSTTMTFSFTFFLLFSVLHFFLCGQSSGSSHMWDFFSCFFLRRRSSKQRKSDIGRNKKKRILTCVSVPFFPSVFCASHVSISPSGTAAGTFFLPLLITRFYFYFLRSLLRVIFITTNGANCLLQFDSTSIIFFSSWSPSSYFYLPIPYFLKRRSKNDWIVA